VYVCVRSWRTTWCALTDGDADVFQHDAGSLRAMLALVEFFRARMCSKTAITAKAAVRPALW